jgi:hypothetical protein
MHLKCSKILLTELAARTIVARKHMHSKRASMFAAAIEVDDKTETLRMLFGFINCKGVHACGR